MLSPRWRKVARDLWSNKSRTILVIASIAIGVFAFGGLFLALSMFLSDLDPQFQAMNPNDMTFTLSPFDDPLVEWFKQQPLVIDAQPRTEYPVDIRAGDELQPARLTAYQDYDDIRVNIIYPEDGAYPPALGEVLIERSFVEGLDVEIGDRIEITTLDGVDHSLRFTGTVHNLREQPGQINPVALIYVSQRTLLDMNLNDAYNQAELQVNRDAGVELTLIADNLRDELQRRGVVVQQTTIEFEDAHWSEDIVGGLSIVLVFSGLGSLFLSAFLVVNTISGIMTSQKRQIGVMKIIGASRPQIITIYLVMVGLLGVLAFLIALPMSVALGVGLVNYFSSFLNYNAPQIVIPLYVILLEAGVALLVPLLAALQPVLAGTRLTAAEAISDHNVSSQNNLIDVLLARLGGLPRPILISIRNTFRRKIRLLVTVFTLTLAGAFFISILNVRTGLLGDIDKLLALVDYDIQYVLTRPADRVGLERRIADFPGVAIVESRVETSVTFERADRTQSGSYGFVGLLADSAFVNPLMVEGTWLLPYDRTRENDIVITDILQLNEPSLQVGAEVKLRRGNQNDTFRIVGVVDSDFESVYGYFDTVQAFRGTVGLTDRIVLRVSGAVPNDQHNTLSLALTDYLDDRNIKIASTTLNVDIVEGITGGFNVLVYLLLGVAILIAVVAGLGLTGTMSLNVMERTREIGVMRAVGAGNNVIRLMFVGEGVLIGMISVLFALPLSIPSTVIFANVLGDVIFGNPLSVVVLPVGILIWFVIVTVVSSMASIAPANRASQISIREAIAYE